MADGDDVQLPDLQVIQRYSLAVRGASAPRDEVIAALQSDLAWLQGGARRTAGSVRKAAPRPAVVASSSPAPAGKPAAKAPATRTPAKKSAPTRGAASATSRTPAKKGARRA